MFEVRLESVTFGKFNFVEHIFHDKDAAINVINDHVHDGFACHGLNDGDMTYAYGHVVDEDNRIIYRKSRVYI